ncbi:MAG: hypothetical protein DUW69_000585 [Verrucomicrobia bacterium]|jgi:hypothetical protein|nr:MAG: hypothetical protein DUW69_000585 [Verrucomicrobiota bacterium]
MNWMRTNRVFALVILGLGLLVISESGLLGERWVAAREARRQREKVSRELRALAALQPTPTAENARLIEADRVRTTRTLAELKTVLVPAGSGPARELPVPAHRAEAFFELAEFVEAMRARARQAGVMLRTDERFGFAGYAHEAPESGQIAAVLRERLRMQTLLEALLEAQPHEIISCQRELPVERVGEARRFIPERTLAARAPGVTGEDYFTIDPRISRRAPGLVETAAFRLSFTGRTETLRTLLNRLGELEPPVLVRAVEVTVPDRPRESRHPVGVGTVPLVSSPWSRFTVTVEFINLPAQPAETF